MITMDDLLVEPMPFPTTTISNSSSNNTSIMLNDMIIGGGNHHHQTMMMMKDLPPVPLATCSGGGNSGGQPRGGGGQQQRQLLSEVTNSGIPAFPWRLHTMLDDASKKDYEHIVSWQKQQPNYGAGGGDAMMIGSVHNNTVLGHQPGIFKVHDPKAFVQLIMPSFFNQTQYKSFQRQLNIYGFQRITHGCNKGAYTHDLFVRGKPELCHLMIRTKIKNKGCSILQTTAAAATASSGGGLVSNRSCPNIRTATTGNYNHQANSTRTNNTMFGLATSSTTTGGGGGLGTQKKYSVSLDNLLGMPLRRREQPQEEGGGGMANQQWEAQPPRPMMTKSGGNPSDFESSSLFHENMSYSSSIIKKQEDPMQPLSLKEIMTQLPDSSTSTGTACTFSPDIAEEIARIFG